MSTISIVGSGGMAAVIGGLAAKAAHTVEEVTRDASARRACGTAFCITSKDH